MQTAARLQAAAEREMRLANTRRLYPHFRLHPSYLFPSAGYCSDSVVYLADGERHKQRTSRQRMQRKTAELDHLHEVCDTCGREQDRFGLHFGYGGKIKLTRDLTYRSHHTEVILIGNVNSF